MQWRMYIKSVVSLGVGGAAESQNGCNGRAIRVRIIRVTAPVATALGPPSLGSGGGRCFSKIVIPSKDRVPAASPSAARMVRRRLRLFGGGAGTPQLNRLIRPFRPRRRLYADSRDEAPWGLPNADSWKDGVVAEAKPPAARKSWLFRSSTPMLGVTARASIGR